MAAKGEREVRVRFTGESAVLKGAAGDVRKVFQMMTSDIIDTRSASEKLAAAQTQVANSMRKDMKAIADAADVVRDSLGPEMVQAIEASGRSVEDQVQEWRKLGLTLDEIKMDSGKLADGMKQLDDAARMSAGAVGDGFKKISAAADNSRSVVANFTGNMASELPGVAGAFGPLNMAIGQFAEYATEGNISMKNFVTAAGGMTAAVIAFQLLGNAIEALGEKQRVMDARTEEVGDALADQVARVYELATAAGSADPKVIGLARANEALSRALTLTGENGDRTTAALGTLGMQSAEAAEALRGIKDDPVKALTAIAEGMGYTSEQAAALAALVNETDDRMSDFAQTGGGDSVTAMDKLRAALAAVVPEAELYDAKMLATGDAMEELQDQAQNTDFNKVAADFLVGAAASNEFAQQLIRQAEANTGASRSGEEALLVYDEYNRLLVEADAATRDAVLGTHEHEDAVRAQEDALRAEEDAQRAATEAAQAAEDAIRDLASAQLASIDTTYAVRDAQDQFIESMEALATATDDPKTGVDELRQAQDTATQSALAAAEAAQANAEALAIAAGAPLDAAASNQVLIDSLSWTALSLDENSPVRKALLDHIATLQGVPATTGTTVVADTVSASDAIRGIQEQADELGNTSSTAETDAETETALDKVTTLTGAVDDLDGRTITLGVELPIGPAVANLKALRTELQLTIDKANEADRAVARVAG